MADANTLRLVAVDPGFNLGLAALDFNVDTLEFKVLDAYTFDLNRYIPSEDDVDKRITSIKRLIKIKSFIARYAKVWEPDYVFHETAFVPNRGGGASIYSFASLIENIMAIKFGFMKASIDIKIFEVNPNNVKMKIVGFRSSDKSLILSSLKKRKDLDLSEIDVGKLNQHNSDAIAICITGVLENFTITNFDGKSSFSFRGRLPCKLKIKKGVKPVK